MSRARIAHRSTKALAAAALATALAGGLLVGPGAQAQVPWPQASISGYATGSVVHTHALQSGTTRLANVDVAFSAATVASQLAAQAQILTELERVLQPEATAPRASYARGSGLEAGLALDPPSDDAQLILAGLAEATAPPSSGLQRNEVGPVNVDPALFAAVLRGEALANWDTQFCILGTDISRGLGYAADVQLLDLGGNDSDELDAPLVALDAPNPARGVSQSLSRTKLVPQTNAAGAVIGPNFGLMSEVRQTIAPLTLFKGSDNQITVEFLGEWVLRAVASGVPDGAYVHYGPGEASPETPILRIINSAGAVTDILTAQDVLGDEGLAIPLPGGLGEIVIGEDPRAIGGDHTSEPEVAANGTAASAAVDVARVRLTPSATLEAVDLRVGHMEVQTQVPAGGISCPLPVAKTANPPQVNVGEQFVTTITVSNPFNCVLTNVQVTDVITTVGAARFSVVGTTPPAQEVPSGTNLASGTVRWTEADPVQPGGSAVFTVTLDAQGGAGRIDDVATATAVLADCEGEDAAVAGTAVAAAGAGLTGGAEFQVPVGAVAGDVLPRTGPASAATAFAAGFGLVGLAVLTRRWTARA